MTPVRRQNATPHGLPPQPATGGELWLEAGWPTALRALLLLSDAAHPADPALARLSDEDLARLRASLALLTGGESTSVA